MPSDPYEHVLPKAVATIRAASAVAAKDIKFHTSVDHSLSAGFEASGQKLLALANKLLASANGESGNTSVLEYGETAATSDGLWKKVADALDVFFEKADLAMDAMKTPSQKNDFLSLNDASDAPLTATVAEKPQVHFKVPVDNTETHPFKPKLTEKPHAITPLAKCLKLVEDGSLPVHYVQPYHEEIMTSPYPASIMEKTTEQPPTDWNSTQATWVDSVEALDAMVAELSQCTEIAVDLEHHDLRTYYGITCLMQISSRTQDWIVDTLALRDDLLRLNVVFSNPQIVKIFHGANMDIVWLQRDLGLYVVSLFDTYFASKALGFPKFSLAYLLESLAKFRTSKKYQLADWRVRPLPSVMLDYARADTHFLLNIYDQLRNRLLTADPGKLIEVLENSRKVALKRFEYVKFRPLTAYNSGMFNNDSISGDHFITLYNIPHAKHALVHELFLWRDQLARDLDESPRYIMPSRVLLNICLLNEPITSQQISNCFTNFSKILRENLDLLTSLVQKCFSAMDEVEKSRGHVETKVQKFEATPQLVAEMTELYALIVERTGDIYDQQNGQLIADESRILLGFLQDLGFSVQVPEDDSVPTVVDISEIKQRLESVRSITFTPLKPVADAFTEPETSVSKPSAKQDSEISPAEEDTTQAKDEIVTLLPKKNRKPLNKKKHVQEEPTFDYLALESKLLANDGSHIRRKKRSFEPFNKPDTDAPQPFKGRKLAPQGKTTSFIKKRK